MEDDRTANSSTLKQYIAERHETLLATLRLYVARSHLAEGQVIASTASELLSEVVVEALDHADRFRPCGQPMAWLLGIAANLIKRRQAELARRNRREPLARDLCPDTQELMNDDEVFDQFASLSGPNSTHDLEVDERVSSILDCLSEPDQQVVRLTILYGLSGEMLAQELGITPGAARVRLHRALSRLREAQQAELRMAING
jgi:RNA polymerase sigma-70 factor (ECF subfamily)